MADGSFVASCTSGHEQYLHVCATAVTDPEAMKAFKSHPFYRAILEHVSPELGQRYIDHTPSELLRADWLRKLQDNDRIGAPVTAEYQVAGAKWEFSPTTLRYNKVLSDLLTLCPTITEQVTIVEIGCGYGGQAKIILDHLGGSVSNYYLLDLPQVCPLITAYHRETLSPSMLERTHVVDVSSDERVAAVRTVSGNLKHVPLR